MAKTAKTINLSAEEEAFILAFRSLVGTAPAVAEVVDEDDEDVEEVEDDEEEEVEPLDREETAALGIKDLRTLAKEYLGDDAPTKKADILEALEDYYSDEEEDEDEDDEDVEEADEDEEDEGEYDRDDLADLDLKELRVIAKEEGHKPAEWKGMDSDAIIDLIMGEVEDDEEEDEDEDSDEEELDEDDLKAMSHKELVTLAKELDLKVPVAVKKDTKANHKKLVNLILDSGDEE